MMKHRNLHSLLTVSLLLLCATPGAPAELRLTPTLGVAEDVTDNANETPSHRKVELLTVVQPGGAVKYATPSSTLDLAYHMDYRYFAEGTLKNQVNHTLALQGSFALVDQFLKLDVSDTLSRISLDVARDTTAESSYRNQTDQNTATVSPYLDWRLSDKTRMRTGARYTDIRYWSDLGIDRHEAGVFAEVTDELSSRCELTGRYVYNRTKTQSVIIEDNLSGTSRRQSVSYQDHDLSGGFRYQYATDSFLYGSVGYGWQKFSYQHDLKNLFWDGGISNRFGTTIATLETKTRYTEDPLSVSLRQTSYSLRIDKRLHRGTLGFAASYDYYRPAAGSQAISIVAAGSDVGSTAPENRHAVTISLTGTREIRPDLTASLTVTGDRVTHSVSTDYPYHLTVNGTLMHPLGEKSSLNLSYTYATYRYRLDEARGAVDVNRLIVQILRSF